MRAEKCMYNGGKSIGVIDLMMTLSHLRWK